ncbi:MAG: hypothetical protein ACK5MW_04030 [Enterococcus sp.]
MGKALYRNKTIPVLFASLVYLFSLLAGIGVISVEFSSLLLAGVISVMFLLIAIVEEVYWLDLWLIFFNLLIVILTGQLNLIFPSLLLMSNRIIAKFNYNSQTIKKILLIITTIFAIIVLLYLLIGFNQRADIEMWRIDELISRKALGFVHPNVCMLSYLAICLFYLVYLFFTYKEKPKRNRQLLLVLLLVGSTIWLYQQTLSRTTAIIVIIGMISYLIRGQKIMKDNVFLYRVMSCFPIILFILSLFVLWLPINDVVDELLSGRVTLYKSFFQNSGFTLLGNSQLETAMFDNSYLQMILTKGIVYSVFFLINMYIILSRGKNKSELLSILLMMVLAIGFTETVFSKLELWIPILFLLNSRVEE